MSRTNIKDILLKRAERSFFLKIFLMFFFYIKPQNRQPQIGRLELIFTFGLFKSYYLLRRFVFLMFKLLNFFRELPLFLKFRHLLLTWFKKQCLVTIPLPKNLCLKDNMLFRHKNYFYLTPHFLKLKKNGFAFISSDMGIIFKNLIIDNDSIHGKFDKRNLKILKPYDSLVFENYLAQVVHKTPSLIIKKDSSKKYLLIHHWFNYYHWFTETYCRLLSIEKEIETYTLLLPETLKDIPFVQDALKLLPPLNIEYIKEGSIVKYDKLYFVNNKKYCDNYAIKELLKLKNLCTSYIEKQHIHLPLQTDRIFIVRSQSYSRNITNLDEVKKVLLPLGFSFVEMETYSFYEQVVLMHNAKILIGPHGAGLTNMIFMKEGAHIMELHREINSRKDHHSTVYWRLAGVLKHCYYYQFCKTHSISDMNLPKGINKELHNFSLEVDITHLKQTVEKMIAHE